jgi:hypothetical protein
MLDDILTYYGVGLVSGLGLGAVVWMVSYAVMALIRVLSSMSGD